MEQLHPKFPLNVYLYHVFVMNASSTMSAPLPLDGTVLKKYDELSIVGATIVAKMTFDNNIRSVFRDAA